MRAESQTSYSSHVAWGTISFALCFAAWGLISAFAPEFRKMFQLTPTQGGALGVYGLGNIGQSAAVFLGPLVAASVGWQSVYRGMAVLLVL